MNFLGGTLPNVMFLVGVLAVGLGLGIELKLVPLNKEVGRFGRVGAFVLGLMLIGGSLGLYLNPSLVNNSQPTLRASLGAAGAAPTAAVVAEPTPQATAVPQATAALAGAAPVAAAQVVAAAPQMTVPDLHGLDEKGAQRALTAAGLQAQKADACGGADQGDPKGKKNRVVCQNPAAGQLAAPGTVVEYVLAGK
jgi:hypothetical protein